MSGLGNKCKFEERANLKRLCSVGRDSREGKLVTQKGK